MQGYTQEQTERYEKSSLGIVGASLADGRSAQTKLPLAEQDKVLAALQDSISELSSRLSPILEPDYPSEGPMNKEATQREGSPLYNQLCANNYGFQNAVMRIESILKRIEC